MTAIGDDAFAACYGLTSVNIPASVITIGEGAFAACSGLTSIALPAGLTALGSDAFLGCDGLTSISLSRRTAVGLNAFPGGARLAYLEDGGGEAASNAQSRAGLYAGTAFQGSGDLCDALDWLTANAQSGGNYTIVLDKDQAITPTELSYDKKTVTITLKSDGSKRTVKFEGASPAYSLFTVGAGVTFVLEEGLTLTGTQNDADKSLIRIVAGGQFIMNGGVLTGNHGGGVRVVSGSFTMNGGTVNGNTTYNGGGVYVRGTFTMNNGTISGNTVSFEGGGVYVKGTFTMNDGIISDNEATAGWSWPGQGGGVYVEGTFTMNGGTVNGNTTYNGGGVYVNGSFTMSNGTISGNTSGGKGGGVYAGTFTIAGGTISRNTTRSYGGGVFVASDGGFTKTGGIIYGSNAAVEQANKAPDDSKGHAVYLEGGKKRNTTARAGAAMDSKKDGPSGGWE